MHSGQAIDVKPNRADITSDISYALFQRRAVTSTSSDVAHDEPLK